MVFKFTRWIPDSRTCDQVFFFSGIGSADRKRGKTKREEGRLIAAVSFWILDSLLVELEFWIPSAESLIPSSRIPDSIIKNFPNFGIRIALPLFILFPSQERWWNILIATVTLI